jgi:hypothetical protein
LLVVKGKSDEDGFFGRDEEVDSLGAARGSKQPRSLLVANEVI